MSTDAAALSRETPRGRVETLVDELATLVAGLLGGGALLYFAWNWALAPAIVNLRPLDNFWMGPMLATGLYLFWTVWTAIRNDDVAIDLENIDALVTKVAPLAGLLALFWAVHHYLL